ncbi:tetratricopeptide repeat protein [Streptomyces sp. NPDC017520]|uniref:tetratricopeptide repeat protein n=1 Tax=Streptomyces sp. NPDC017520 TaxID=3364998 RepID=UPI00379DF829
MSELAALADELGLPELQCRAWSSLARCLRGSGRVSESIAVADRAVKLAKEAKLTVPDIGNALISLVSAEAEEGRLPDARAHVDELVELVDKHEGPLKAEALWSAATVRFRQGEHGAALEFIERATQGLEGSADLTLWLRLRLAAASLSLQSDPPRSRQAFTIDLSAEIWRILAEELENGMKT